MNKTLWNNIIRSQVPGLLLCLEVVQKQSCVLSRHTLTQTAESLMCQAACLILTSLTDESTLPFNT